MNTEKMKQDLGGGAVFDMGEPNTAFGQYFAGQSYLKMLTTEGVGIGNVTFEPGCRNNWHIHHAKKNGGQILLCTGGRGWYQEWGERGKRASSRRRGGDSPGSEALAWGSGRQLVCPSGRGGSRRRDIQ